MPVARKFNDERQKKSSARLKERSLAEWGAIFIQMASTFKGRDSNEEWVPGFDWIIKNNDNADKVLEGRYSWLTGTSRPSDSRYNEIFAGA